MPTATDLVTDLPADFNVFGQGVDTSMADLLGGTTGQVLSKTSATSMDFTWVTAQVGDITAVNVTSPITGGGSSGDVTIAIQDALTTQKGSVQLSDSTSTTSSVLAATPTAVKSAYDLANAAIPKTLTTTTGDTIYASAANTPARLGIGSTGQILTVAAGLPSWAAAATPTKSWTQVATGSTTSGAALNLTGLTAYDNYFLVFYNIKVSVASDQFTFYFNADTGSALYTGAGWEIPNTSAYSATNLSNSNTPQAFAPGGNSSYFSNVAASTLTFSITGCKSAVSKQFDSQYFSQGGGKSGLYRGIYRGTAALSSLNITLPASTFVTGTYYLYGAN